MIAYGKRKTTSGKIHPHNECSICAEKNICKKTERRKAKEDIKKELETILNRN